MKILAKTIKHNKIVKDFVYEINEDFVIHNFFDYMNSICEALDLPVPIILTKHIKNFLLFDSTFFTQEDFVEKFYEDKLVIEIIKS